jgi:hypothetical protein
MRKPATATKQNTVMKPNPIAKKGMDVKDDFQAKLMALKSKFN